MGGTGNLGQEPEAQKAALGHTPSWAGTGGTPGTVAPTPTPPAPGLTAPERGYGPSMSAAAANPSLTQNLGFPSQNKGFTHAPANFTAGGSGIVDYSAPAAPPAAPAAGPDPAAAAAAEKAKADEWVSVYLPESARQSWYNGGIQQGGSANGIYMPKDMNALTAYGYMDPAYTGDWAQKPPGFSDMKVGSTLDAKTAENFPRMRRSLYDFNMSAYGNPYGPGGYAPPTAQNPTVNTAWMNSGGG